MYRFTSKGHYQWALIGMSTAVTVVIYVYAHLVSYYDIHLIVYRLFCSNEASVLTVIIIYDVVLLWSDDEVQSLFYNDKLINL